MTVQLRFIEHYISYMILSIINNEVKVNCPENNIFIVLFKFLYKNERIKPKTIRN